MPGRPHASGSWAARGGAADTASARAARSSSVARGNRRAAVSAEYASASSSAIARKRSRSASPAASPRSIVALWTSKTGRPSQRRATIATSDAPSAAATAAALPPPGTGRPEASSSVYWDSVRSRAGLLLPAGCSSTRPIVWPACHGGFGSGDGASAVPARPPRNRTPTQERGRSAGPVDEPPRDRGRTTLRRGEFGRQLRPDASRPADRGAHASSGRVSSTPSSVQRRERWR